MTNSRVTIKDVYEVTDRIETKLDKMGERITTLEIWRANIMGKVTMLAGFFSLSFTMAWEFIRSKVKK